MHAQDVIHSFWVPEWRIKKDNVPGITTTAIVTPDKVGTYQLICTELCGFGHATMRAKVVVEPPANFRKWVGGLKEKVPPPLAGVDQPGHRDQPGAARRRRGIMEAMLMVAAIKQPGWIRGALGALARRGLRLRPRRRPARDLRPAALPDRTDRLPAGRRAADHRRRSASSPASAASTTGCAGPPACRRSPTTTPSTAPRAGRTTSTSTPITR